MKQYISLLEATKLVPTKPAVSTLWRWCTWGVCSPRSKEVVKLRSVVVGRRIFTTEEWIEQFFEDCAAARENAREPKLKPAKRITPNRRRQIEQAEDILRRAGI